MVGYYHTCQLLRQIFMPYFNDKQDLNGLTKLLYMTVNGSLQLITVQVGQLVQYNKNNGIKES